MLRLIYDPLFVAYCVENVHSATVEHFIGRLEALIAQATLALVSPPVRFCGLEKIVVAFCFKSARMNRLQRLHHQRVLAVVES